MMTATRNWAGLSLVQLSLTTDWYKEAVSGLQSREAFASNSPQRLLPLISTVTTATTRKSGSREPDLFFSLLFLKQNTLYYFSFLSLNYYDLCTRKFKKYMF